MVTVDRSLSEKRTNSCIQAVENLECLLKTCPYRTIKLCHITTESVTGDEKKPTVCSLVDDSEFNLSIAAMHVWRVEHPAAVGTIKGRGHLQQGDGGVLLLNIP